MNQFVKGVYIPKKRDKMIAMNDTQTEETAKLEAWRQFTNKQFLLWQQKFGTRKTVTEFAESIGFPQSTVSLWLNGSRRPKSMKDLERISSAWGIAVYDTLNIERPDESLFNLKLIWKDLPIEKRRSISEEASEYAKKKKKK